MKAENGQVQVWVQAKRVLKKLQDFLQLNCLFFLPGNVEVVTLFEDPLVDGEAGV